MDRDEQRWGLYTPDGELTEVAHLRSTLPRCFAAKRLWEQARRKGWHIRRVRVTPE